MIYLHQTSQNTKVSNQSPVTIWESSDGQVFIQRDNSLEDDVCELTIHEWQQLRDDIKAGKFDDETEVRR